VDNRLRLQLAELPAELAEELRVAATHKNPAYYKLRSMGYAAGKERPNYRLWTEKAGELSLPRGMTTDVRRVCATYGVELEWLDNRSSGSGEPLVAEHDLELWAHQDGQSG
jgi:hypothetical protein